MDKTPEMVERVAMALDQCRSNFIALRLIDKTPDYDIDEALARAAIEALISMVSSETRSELEKALRDG